MIMDYVVLEGKCFGMSLAYAVLSRCTSCRGCENVRRRQRQKNDTGMADHELSVRGETFLLYVPVYRL